MREGCSHLDDWLILAQSREQLSEQRYLVLSHLSQLGLKVNWEKSKLAPVQRISFLSMELDSVEQFARLTEERAQSVLTQILPFFKYIKFLQYRNIMQKPNFL